jgi:HlyD family secretion protein
MRNLFSNRRFVIIGAVVLVLLVLFFGYNAAVAPALRPTPTPVVVKPTQQVVSAEGVVLPVSRATLAFKTGGRVGQLPVREGAAVKAGDLVAKLDTAMLEAQANQAEAAYNSAKILYDRVKATNANNIQIAIANLQKLQQGPTAAEIAVAEAKAYEAYVKYAQAEDAYQRFGWVEGPAEINLRGARDQAGAANTTAQAELTRVKTGARPEDIAAAQAQLDLAQGPAGQAQVRAAQADADQAQAAFDLAKANLRDAIIVAPFDAVVSLISVDVGEVVTAGEQIIQLGDLTKWQVETTDLAEVDVARVAAGQTANLSIDAFPGKIFNGTVTRVAQAANERSGKKVFKVVIDVPDAGGITLRWGMTANVEIVVGK